MAFSNARPRLAKKWATPPDTIPYFNEAKEVKLGDKLMVLTFFTNPGVDANGKSHVKCTLKVERPDGSLSIKEQSFDCINGEMKGNPRYIQLSPAVVQFTAEENAPLGEWSVYVTLKDENKKVFLKLRTIYNFIGKGG